MGLIRYHAGALVLCGLALLVGVATLEDYGVMGDSYDQRAIADVTLRYLASDGDAFETLDTYSDRFYGTAFEVPLLLAERLLGLEDSRSAFLVRHLLSHLFFLAAGGAGYLLALRLFRNRAVALFAMALFLLHPRIYVHSFSNSKDVPFLALFMICLWLACRGFGGGRGAAGSLGAFALCGVAAGLLVNLRVMGLAFVAVVAAARVCDLWGARGEWRLALATLIVFLASAALAYCASMPYLWADPFGRFVELLSVFSNHPTRPTIIFQGEQVSAAALPAQYMPVWFAITTPPLALLLGAVGVASLLRRSMARPSDLLRSTPLRFELLLVACVALPVLAIVILRPVMYSGWRHMYFLWAPFALLAASGLRALADAPPRLHLPRHLPLTPRLAVFAVHGLAALGLAAVAVQMARLHPHQYLYFNALATRTSSEPLHERYQFDYVTMLRLAYAYILEESPGKAINMQLRHRMTPRRERIKAAVGPAAPRHLDMFPLFEQQRITFDGNADPDFYINWSIAPPSTLAPPVLYERRVYGSRILSVETPHLARVDAATADAYRALYRDIAADVPALGGGDIDVYRSETAVTWAKEACAPGDLHWRASLTAHPVDTGKFSAFRNAVDGVRIGSACVWQALLPAHALAKIHLHGIGRLVSDAYLDELRARYATLAAMPPAAGSTFDVHLRDGTLFYVRTPCVQADIEATFFLHVVPVDANDLHDSRRRHGFDAQDFRTDGTDIRWRYASADVFDGACVVEWELPGYPIAHIATGQYVHGVGDLWRVDFSVEDG